MLAGRFSTSRRRMPTLLLHADQKVALLATDTQQTDTIGTSSADCWLTVWDARQARTTDPCYIQSNICSLGTLRDRTKYSLGH